jgi:hypothetical protein
MALILARVQNVANRSEHSRINAMHIVQKFEPDSRGLDPATHRASVRERWTLFGAQTRAGWVAASRAAMTVERFSEAMPF